MVGELVSLEVSSKNIWHSKCAAVLTLQGTEVYVLEGQGIVNRKSVNLVSEISTVQVNHKKVELVSKTMEKCICPIFILDLVNSF